jgi:baculoviral IAP repeat-containing protein 7/8
MSVDDSTSISSFENSDDDESFNLSGMQSEYAKLHSYESRLETFETWHPSLVQKPEKLAEAGFFYTGRGDGVICFHCGQGVGNWEVTDDPWIEHARWHGNICGFVQIHKGIDFVRQHLEKTKMSNFKPLTHVEVPEQRQECNKVHEEDDRNTCQNQSLTCKVCLLDDLGVIFVPCGHVICCVTCAFSVNKCPFCRKYINSAIRVHFS